MEVLQSSLLPSESARWIESRCHNEGVALFNLHRFKQVTFDTALWGHGEGGTAYNVASPVCCKPYRRKQGSNRLHRHRILVTGVG